MKNMLKFTLNKYKFQLKMTTMYRFIINSCFIVFDKYSNLMILTHEKYTQVLLEDTKELLTSVLIVLKKE